MDTDRADLGDQRTSGAATYSVQAHPDDSAPGTLLISYAVNGGGVLPELHFDLPVTPRGLLAQGVRTTGRP